MSGYFGPAAGCPGLTALLDRARSYPRAVVLLTVACPRDHALARVVDTAGAPTLVWDAPVATSSDGVIQRRSRVVATALTLDDDPETLFAEVTCRCGTGGLRVHDVRRVLASGRRRVIATRDDPRVGWTLPA